MLNMYVILMDEKGHQIRTYENVNCCGIKTITNSFSYALCQETSSSQKPGLKYFDMNMILKEDKPKMILLKKIDVGALGSIEEGYFIKRLGFLNSISSLIITPILH